MKTSKKILLGLAVLILVLMTSGLVILRADLKTLLAKEATKHKFKVVPSSAFKALNFTGNWSATIKQGDQHKVEIGEESLGQVKLETINDTLYLIASGNGVQTMHKQIQVRVTVPKLGFIKAVGNTRLYMDKFETDSLYVVLEDSAVFTGKRDKIKHVSFQTKGKAQIQLEHNPEEL